MTTELDAYKCERCDGGRLTREDEDEFFTCDNCECVVAPELAKRGEKVAE